jgi:hypothetical protein
MESPTQKANLFSWSAIVRYAVISAINLALLLVGIAVGVMLAPHIEKPASAASVQQSATPQQAASASSTTSGGVKLTPVQPGMQVGTVAVYISLAHHIQSDELVVNGLNLLQLHQEEINLLSKFVPAQEISNAIARSKATELYTVGPPPSAPAPAAPAPK